MAHQLAVLLLDDVTAFQDEEAGEVTDGLGEVRPVCVSVRMSANDC